MPSLRSICMGLLLTPLLQLSTAIPVAPAADCVDPKGPTPTLPASSTPLPVTSLALKYVLIGRGTQNYTCSAPSAAPVAVGAVATLYDATALAYRSTKTLNTIPPLAVNVPIPKASAQLTLAGQLIKPIGNHFFDSAGTPIFNLASVKKILYAAKVTGVPAPTGASLGAGGKGNGAVDWLYLTAKANYTASVGLGAVYRVVTAGGKAVCDTAGPKIIDYAAEYWFYA